MNAYMEAMKQALLRGYHIPELESCWFRETDFQTPKFYSFHHH